MVELSSIVFIGICLSILFQQKINLSLGFRVGKFCHDGLLTIDFGFFSIF